MKELFLDNWMVIARTAFIFIVIKIINYSLDKIAKQYSSKFEKKLYISTIFNIVKAIIWIIGISIICSQFEGFSTTVASILASSGILALGVSMAAQESLTNLIDGIFISVYKPFDIGDRVTLPEHSGITGTITEMNLRHTVITTFKNTKYIISNSTLSNSIIENSSDNEHYTYPIDISITYDSNIDKAIEIIENIISNHPDFVDTRTEQQKANNAKKVNVLFREYAASSIELRASMVTKDISTSFKACSDIRYQIKKAFDNEPDVNFPFTTITIDNKN